jgi:LmbE family N-acetylglucosaminyl deacetylase
MFSNTNFLLVCAHPDDETLFGGTIFKLTRVLGAKVDILLITNGEGGYRNSTILELMNGVKTTQEYVAREHLPSIRKHEMLKSCDVLGIRDCFMLDEKDHHYTTDIKEMQNNAVWNNDRVRQEIKRVLQKRHYDFIMVMLPDVKQHAHHKQSAILTLEVIKDMYDFKSKNHPIIIAGTEEIYEDYIQLDGYDITKVVTKDLIQKWNITMNEKVCKYTKSDAINFYFDRRTTFDHNDRLNYRIPVVWAICEHKSQGTALVEILAQDVENFWVFEQFVGEPVTFFERLNVLFTKLHNTQ